MAYTTFTERGHKPGNYDRLEWTLKSEMTKGKPVYAVSILKHGVRDDQIEDLKELFDPSNIRSLNGTYIFVISGEEEAKELVRKLYEKTGQTVGCVKYEGEQHGMLQLYLDMRSSINLAEAKSEPWHFYDPKEDSLQAIIEKARMN